MEKNIVKLEVEVINAVLDFLSKLVFKDVAGIINAIHQSAARNQEKPESESAPVAE